MKSIFILFSLMSTQAFAVPAYLKCSGDIEIDFQSNWVRSSYVILDTAEGSEWFAWTGKESVVSGEEIKTFTANRDQKGLAPLQAIHDNASFTQFELVPEEHWWGRPPVYKITRMHIENELMTNAGPGKVVVQEITEQTGVLIQRHRVNIETRLLDCTAP